MEIITLQNLIKMAKNGHYPLFKKIEVVKSLRNASTPSITEENHLKIIIKKMKTFKTFERKKLFIQSLEQREKELFINHLYNQAHRLNDSKHIKYS